ESELLCSARHQVDGCAQRGGPGGDEILALDDVLLRLTVTDEDEHAASDTETRGGLQGHGVRRHLEPVSVDSRGQRASASQSIGLVVDHDQGAVVFEEKIHESLQDTAVAHGRSRALSTMAATSDAWASTPWARARARATSAAGRPPESHCVARSRSASAAWTARPTWRGPSLFCHSVTGESGHPGSAGITTESITAPASS